MHRFTDTLIMRDFPSFVRECHKIIRNGETLGDDPYLLQLYAVAEDIADGRSTKVALALPPGHAKTFVFGVCLVAWILARDPAASILVITHSKKLAKDTTRRIRKILDSQPFQRVFKTRIDHSWNAAGDFGTTKGGSVFATSPSGTITGYRADVIIIDDPVPIKNANNQAELDFVNEIFDDEILTRMRKNQTRVVVIMHRLNENDLIAHVSQRGDFKTLAIPLIAPKDQRLTCRHGTWVRKKGEQLRRGRYTKRELRDLAFRPSFQFLYQQGMGGGASLRIKPRYFKFREGHRDPLLPIVFSVDTAQKAGTNSSRMVIQVWQTDGRNHDLVDIFAAVCDYERLWLELIGLLRLYPPSLILIEEASTGSALIAQAEARLNYAVRGIVPRGSKSKRLRRHFATLRSGRISLPQAADWAADLINEVCAFPDGDYDDHVDTLSMFLDFMATGPKLLVPKPHVGARLVSRHSNGRTFEFNPTVAVTAGPPIARAQRSRFSPAPMPPDGRTSLNSGTSIQVETRFGSAIITRR